MTPEDIDPQSGCRLPLPQRDALDEAGRRIYDQATDPKGGTIRGLKGPAGIQLHSPALAALVRPVNRYLRYEAGLGGRLRELAILVTARECDSRFEWAAHEPEALKEGVPRVVPHQKARLGHLCARVQAVRRARAGRSRRADGELRRHRALARGLRHAIGSGHDRAPAGTVKKKAAAKTRPTLPDLLRQGLDIVFVGINPSLYSAEKGHYFARPANRFWPAFSRSGLSAAARSALRVDRLLPEHDASMMAHGIGFTDLVKRPSARAAELSRRELEAGADALERKLRRFAPRIACFHGLTAFRPIHRILAPDGPDPRLGLQDLRVGATPLFVVPNPSPANAHFTPQDQTLWYDRLGEALARLPR
jgi:double-stranded uracil-DNA glycosylase